MFFMMGITDGRKDFDFHQQIIVIFVESMEDFRFL